MGYFVKEVKLEVGIGEQQRVMLRVDIDQLAADFVTDLANGLGSNPDEMPDGFLCAQLYSSFSLSQSVTFPSAGRYRLRFHLARRQGFSPQIVVVSVDVFSM